MNKWRHTTKLKKKSKKKKQQKTEIFWKIIIETVQKTNKYTHESVRYKIKIDKTRPDKTEFKL